MDDMTPKEAVAWLKGQVVTEKSFRAIKVLEGMIELIDYLEKRIRSMKMPDLTLCPKCQHFAPENDTGIWHSLYCTAISRDSVIDPCSGKKMYRDPGDTSYRNLSYDKYYRCKEFNDGNCRHYKPKNTWGGIKSWLT